MRLVPITLAVALMSAPAIAEDTRTFNDLPSFDRIDVSAGVILVANVGGPQSVSVTTDDGDFSDFEIEVKNGELNISREWNRLRWHSKKANYKVTVSVPQLNSIDASSGSHAKISKINTSRFTVDVSSGAQATFDGSCNECVIDISSGANMDAKELVCQDANIDVSSGGHGDITVTASVIGDASSGGHVSVYGNPQRVSVDKSSGGRIKIVSIAQATND